MKKRTSMTNEVTIGLDLADQWSDWAAVAEDGTVVRQARVRTTERQLRETFGGMAAVVIAIEVGTHSAWVSRVLRSCGHTVVVANARRVALIHRNRRKTNRIDAEFLARLARADRALLFPIAHRSEASQQDLSVLRTRDVLVRTRTKLINHVRGTSKSFGVRLARCSAESFARRSRAAAAELEGALLLVLDQLDMVNAQIRELDRRIEKMLGRYPAAQRLTQIVGVGALTALAFVLTIDDPKRIVRSRSAGAFPGLVPGSDDSGEKHEQRGSQRKGTTSAAAFWCRQRITSSGHSAATVTCGGTARPSPLAARRTDASERSLPSHASSPS
jgi:transposase